MKAVSRPWCASLSLLVFILVSLPSIAAVWPWAPVPKPDISSAAKCRHASRGHVHKGDSIYPSLQVRMRKGLLQAVAVSLKTTPSTQEQLLVPSVSFACAYLGHSQHTRE